MKNRLDHLLLRSFGVATIILIACTSSGFAQTCKGPEAVTDFGIWSSPNVELSATKPNLPLQISGDGKKIAASRLLFRVLAKKSDDHLWSIVVRDTQYRPLVTLTESDFKDKDGVVGGTRWTGRLPDAKFRIELNSAAPIENLRILISDAIALPADTPNDVHLFSLQDEGNPKWVDLYSDQVDTTAKRNGDAVAMIYGGKDLIAVGGRRSWCCSGVLIAPTLLLTNWHCGGVPNSGQFWDGVTCGNTLIDFSWDGGKVSRQFSCVSVEAKSQMLDYAVLRIRPVIGGGSGRVDGFTFPRLRSAGLEGGDGVQVVHHAKCGFKLISTNCNVGSVGYPSWTSVESEKIDIPKNPEITHTCDTEPGASGAPVFDVKGRLIALHHLGFARNDACVPLDRVNKAVELKHILAHIGKKYPSILDEIKLAVE